jgi:quercetin dioxygenase-like cupin family protein
MKKIITSLLASSLIMGIPITHAADTSGKVMKTPQQIQWKEPYVKIPGEVKMAYLQGDPKKAGPYTIRIKFPPHYQVAVHSLPKNETMTVLSGTLFFAFENKQDKRKAHKLAAGSFVIEPANTPYFRFTRDEETIIQVQGEGPRTITFSKDGGTTGPAKPEADEKK